jgi:hypothetical protein
MNDRTAIDVCCKRSPNGPMRRASRNVFRVAVFVAASALLLAACHSDHRDALSPKQTFLKSVPVPAKACVFAPSATLRSSHLGITTAMVCHDSQYQAQFSESAYTTKSKVHAEFAKLLQHVPFAVSKGECASGPASGRLVAASSHRSVGAFFCIYGDIGSGTAQWVIATDNVQKRLYSIELDSSVTTISLIWPRSLGSFSQGSRSPHIRSHSGRG